MGKGKSCLGKNLKRVVSEIHLILMFGSLNIGRLLAVDTRLEILSWGDSFLWMNAGPDFLEATKFLANTKLCVSMMDLTFKMRSR